MKPIEKVTFDDVIEMNLNREFENKVTYSKQNLLSKDHIFDEEKSVKWNKQQVEAFNNQIIKSRQDYKDGISAMEDIFSDCLVSAISNYTRLSKDKSEIIFSKAYSNKCSYGYSEVITYAIEICDFLMDILIEKV